jgi:stalled ribosome rescue protein Dom34
MNNQKQFGVWMDNHQAAVVGSRNSEEGSPLTVVAHIKGSISGANSNERTANNSGKTLQTKYFKEIASHMPNATHVHVTGTGQVQEQFIRYLASTPQFKNSKTGESTSTKMTDDKLIAFITGKF